MSVPFKSALLLVLVGLAARQTTPARACGGFFCNAAVPTVVVQAGERIVFARTDHGVTMHIEVTYQGDPTAFAWLLPLPERPVDDDGAPLPLERAVQVGVSELFTTLQPLTDPTFTLTQGASLGGECDRSNACGGEEGAKSAGSRPLGGSDEGAPSEPGVVVSDEARVGPYDAQLIEAADAGALYAWLGEHGYFQDPAARPLLEHYVRQGFVFVGLRLQNGADVGDIRPIVLHLGETAPCVPLRLTSIAATDDMPILVWVLGPARAVPKNFVHAIVNDRALVFPGGANYQDVVSRAIDTASGHAWVTELSEPTDRFRGAFLSDPELVRERLDFATSLRQVILSLAAPLRTSPSAMQIWRAELRPTDGASQVETYHLLDGSFAQLELVSDVATLRARLYAELIEPLEGVEALFATTRTLTRFFTTSDASEMTKDPVFAFNAELPQVERTHSVELRIGIRDDCTQFGVATYDDGARVRLPQLGTATIGPIPGEPALAVVEVLDEEGPARPFDPLQAVEVDRMLDHALPGIPSLPASFPLEPPPPRADGDGGGDADGCNVGVPGAWLFLPVGFLFLRRRLARRDIRGTSKSAASTL